MIATLGIAMNTSMTEEEFDGRFDEVKQQGAACKDQGLAKLFRESGWTQDRIAEHLGHAQSWVSNYIIFGRFLEWIIANCDNHKLPLEKLSEGRFRGSWKKTSRKLSEEERFAACVPLLEESYAVPSANPAPGSETRQNLRRAVIDLCKDGKRRSPRQVAQELDGEVPGVTAERVRKAFVDLQNRPPKGYTVDTQQMGNSTRLRLSQRPANARPVDADEAGQVIAEVMPMLKEVRAELHKTTAAFSFSFVLERVDVIEKKLKALLVNTEVA